LGQVRTSFLADFGPFGPKELSARQVSGASPHVRSTPLLGPRLVALALALATLLFGFAASAFVPPPIQGHITDTAGKLAPAERRRLDAKLEAVRVATGNEIAVFVVPSLGGETMEDVAFTTFNAWKIGQKGADNGVLLVIAPTGRKIRIAQALPSYVPIPSRPAVSAAASSHTVRASNPAHQDADADQTDGGDLGEAEEHRAGRIAR
jgi:hypothetical protein